VGTLLSGRAHLAIIVLTVLVSVLSTRVIAGFEFRSSPRASAAIQSSVAAPDGTSYFGLTPQFAIAPNGQHVVFVANAEARAPMLWLRSLTSTTARALPGTEQASYPFWSADNRFVGFFASGKLKTIAVDGGASVVVCDAPTGRGGTWNDGNVIVFASGINDPLRKVAASGGPPAPITVVETPRENSHRWPQFFPDGRHLLFWAGAGTGPTQLKIATLDSGDVVTVGPGDANAAYAAGYVFFKTGNTLVAQPFDARALRKTGDPLPIVMPISTDAGSSFASFSVSATGTIVYTQGTARPLVLTWFDRQRAVREAGTAGTLGEPGQYTNVTLSPDGRRLAVSLTAGSPANRDVWILDGASGKPSRVTADPAVDATPIWSPAGTQIAFSSQRAGPYQIYVKDTASASASDETVLLKADAASIATDWSRDGRFIAYTRTAPATGLDLWVLPLSGDRQPFPVLQTPAVEDNAAFSPDGRWIAYQSNASGRDEVYVRSFPPAGGEVLVSRNGGTQPRWRGDGRELFFLAADGSVMAAAVSSGTTFTANEPRTILPASMTLVIRHAYAVSPDGQRILRPVLDQRNPSVLTVVPNWPSTIGKQVSK
jgi:Tol biopolymer transport system component